MAETDTIAHPKKKLSAAERAAIREARLEVDEFYADYADTLERGDIAHWPDYFTDDATYLLIARDNADAGLPLGLIYCDGKGMIEDRTYALIHTEMYAPRYIKLMISNTRVHEATADTIRADANYLLLETLVEEETRVQQVGKYHDVFRRTGDGLLLHDRRAVYDTVMIDNSLVFPV